jgi:hypothetical protein
MLIINTYHLLCSRPAIDIIWSRCDGRTGEMIRPSKQGSAVVTESSKDSNPHLSESDPLYLPSSFYLQSKNTRGNWDLARARAFSEGYTVNFRQSQDGSPCLARVLPVHFLSPLISACVGDPGLSLCTLNGMVNAVTQRHPCPNLNLFAVTTPTSPARSSRVIEWTRQELDLAPWSMQPVP